MDTFCLSEFTSATPTYSNLMLPSYSGTPWRIILCWLLLVRNRCQPDVPHDRNGWWDLFKYWYIYSNRWDVLDLISCALLQRGSWPVIHVKGDHPGLCSQHGIPIRLLLSSSLEWRKILFIWMKALHKVSFKKLDNFIMNSRKALEKYECVMLKWWR